MTQEFLTEELKAELERSLGFTLGLLERLPGRAWSLNFKAVRADDGLVFVVKLVPVAGNALYDSRYSQAVRHLSAMSGCKGAKLLFQSGERRFRDYRVLCLSWCGGVRLYPDQLTVGQLRAFLDDYLAFSECMQRTDEILPGRDGAALKELVLRGLRGCFGRLLCAKLEADMPDADVRHRPELTRVIHGDFHYGNFLFEGGGLSGIFDLEEFRYGYPAEDLVRYVTCAVEHLRWYELRRAGRIRRMFGEMVAYLPYSAHEWAVALNVHFLAKASRTVLNGGGCFGALNLLYRYSFYRRLRVMAGSMAGNGGGEQELT